MASEAWLVELAAIDRFLQVIGPREINSLPA